MIVLSYGVNLGALSAFSYFELGNVSRSVVIDSSALPYQIFQKYWGHVVRPFESHLDDVPSSALI